MQSENTNKIVKITSLVSLATKKDSTLKFTCCAFLGVEKSTDQPRDMAPGTKHVLGRTLLCSCGNE